MRLWRLSFLLLVVSLAAISYAADPLVFHRDGHCPPNPIPKEPIEGSDMFTPGTPPHVDGWLVYRYHWDDGEGNDLTVDALCMTDGEYMSVRVWQSKNGHNTLVASPDPKDRVTDPGHC